MPDWLAMPCTCCSPSPAPSKCKISPPSRPPHGAPLLGHAHAALLTTAEQPREHAPHWRGAAAGTAHQPAENRVEQSHVEFLRYVVTQSAQRTARLRPVTAW